MMQPMRVGPGSPCQSCGDEYGQHKADCPKREEENRPRRFRVFLASGKHANGSKSSYQYGCYFPMTDLVVGDMGGRGTGEPQGVEWLD